MATNGATSPFRRLKEYYDRAEPDCPDCGYHDEDGEWIGETDGRQIHYHHVCPSCGSVREHTVRLRRP